MDIEHNQIQLQLPLCHNLDFEDLSYLYAGLPSSLHFYYYYYFTIDLSFY